MLCIYQEALLELRRIVVNQNKKMSKLENPVIFASLFACLIFFNSCNTSRPNIGFKTKKTSKIRNTVQLKLLSESKLNFETSNILITIYGYDQFMADVEASIIYQKRTSITQLPYNFDLELPENPESLIKPKVSSIENAEYYLSVYCDNNKNGKDDQGDIKIDVDKGFPKINIKSKDIQTFYLKAQ